MSPFLYLVFTPSGFELCCKRLRNLQDTFTDNKINTHQLFAVWLLKCLQIKTNTEK